MSVQFKLNKFFYCFGQDGQPMMMYYNQLTGMLSPFVGTFPQPPQFEIAPSFPQKTASSGILSLNEDSENKSGPDNLTDDHAGPKKLCQRAFNKFILKSPVIHQDR